MEEVEALHRRAQELLTHHYCNIQQFRRKHYDWENCLARLEIDANLLDGQYVLQASNDAWPCTVQ